MAVSAVQFVFSNPTFPSEKVLIVSNNTWCRKFEYHVAENRDSVYLTNISTLAGG